MTLLGSGRCYRFTACYFKLGMLDIITLCFPFISNFLFPSFLVVCYLFVHVCTCVLNAYFLPEWAKLYMCRFIKVEDLKEKLLENNRQTYWVPDFVKVRYPLNKNRDFLYVFLSHFQSVIPSSL